MNIIQKIGKNTIVLFLSRVSSSVLCFLYTVHIARHLGPGGFGVLCFSLAFSRIFGIFTDFGLHLLTVREVSRNRASSDKYLLNLSGMKVVLGSVILLAMTITIHLLHYPLETTRVVCFVGLSVIIDSFSQMFCSLFQAEQRMEFESFGKVLQSLLMVVGVFIAVKLEKDVEVVSIIFAVVSMIVFLYYVGALRVAFASVFHKWRRGWLVEFDWHFWKVTLRQATSFGLAVCFVTIFYWVDSVMLSLIKGDDVVGWYNAAYRLVLVLLLIPGSLISAIYPTMAVLYPSRRGDLKTVFEKSVKYLAIVAIPMGVGTLLLAERFILLFYTPNYQNSVVALQILVWSSVLIFFSQPMGNLFNCLNKQIITTFITGICVILNIVLNLCLIPQYGLVGASIATVVTEFFSLFATYVFCIKLGYGFSGKGLFKTILKVFLSSMVMGLLILWLKDINLFLLVILAILSYFLTAYITGVFDKDDGYILKRIMDRSPAF